MTLKIMIICLSLSLSLWDMTGIDNIRKSICQSSVFFFSLWSQSFSFPHHTHWPDCLQKRTTTCIYIMHQCKCTPIRGVLQPLLMFFLCRHLHSCSVRVPVGRFAEKGEIGQSEGLTGWGRKSAETARRLQFRIKSAEWLKRSYIQSHLQNPNPSPPMEDLKKASLRWNSKPKVPNQKKGDSDPWRTQCHTQIWLSD